MKKINAIACSMMFVLSGCASVNPQTGMNEIPKAQSIGISSALVCGAIGALTHGTQGAINSAVACGLVGTGVGLYMDKQEADLRGRLAKSQIRVQRVGDMIKLVLPENVTFRVNSHAVSSSAYRSLVDVSLVLKAYPETQVTVNGYTDITGSRSYNERLSEKRADSVASTLIGEGVATPRLFAHGFGQQRPVASNATEKGRAMNRRVEILIKPIQR